MTARHTCEVCYSDEHLSVEWCPHVTIDENGVRVFTPPTWRDGVVIDSRDAYDFTQTCEDMRDGDLVVCEHEGERVIAVLVSAWPTRVAGREGSSMHELNPDLDWATFEGGKYVRSVDAAQRFITNNTSTKESN